MNRIMILIEIGIGLVVLFLIVYAGMVLISKMDEKFKIGEKIRKLFG